MNNKNYQIERLIELYEGLLDDSIKNLTLLARKHFVDIEYDLGLENGKIKAYRSITAMLRELLK